MLKRFHTTVKKAPAASRSTTMVHSSASKRLQLMKSAAEEGVPESDGAVYVSMFGEEEAAKLSEKIEEIERILIPKLKYRLDEFEKRQAADQKNLETRLES